MLLSSLVDVNTMIHPVKLSLRLEKELRRDSIRIMEYSAQRQPRQRTLGTTKPSVYTKSPVLPVRPIRRVHDVLHERFHCPVRWRGANMGGNGAGRRASSSVTE